MRPFPTRRKSNTITSQCKHQQPHSQPSRWQQHCSSPLAPAPRVRRPSNPTLTATPDRTWSRTQNPTTKVVSVAPTTPIRNAPTHKPNAPPHAATTKPTCAMPTSASRKGNPDSTGPRAPRAKSATPKTSAKTAALSTTHCTNAVPRTHQINAKAARQTTPRRGLHLPPRARLAATTSSATRAVSAWLAA